jgi:DNA modification methylase
MKPIKLIARQVRNSTKQDETVLDLFGGSGSTLIACEQLGRTCRTMELSEHYCDVIIQRYINLKESTKDVYRIRDGKKTPYDKVFI